MKGIRDKMAESIVTKGDMLYEMEHDGDVCLWLIRDHESYNDPFGRPDQYQVWKGDKRCYVGPNIQYAYADYNKQRGVA